MNSIFYKLSFHITIYLVAMMFYDVDAQACGSLGSTVIVKQDFFGNVMTIWTEKNPDLWCIPVRCAYKAVDGKWAPIKNISKTDGFCELPILELAQNGNAVVIWLQNDLSGRNNHLMLATYRLASNTWSDPVLISDVRNERILNTYYDVCLNEKNEIVVFWGSLMFDISTQLEQRVWRSAYGTLDCGMGKPLTVGIGYPL